MLRKRIAALLAAMMTISSLGTAAFAAVEDGLTYDELLGNVISNGTFENGVEGWLPDTGISKEMDNTRLNSAGAALVNQADGTVYSSFEMESHKYYSAEAYVKLYNDEEDDAKIVFANENGDLIASTAVKTTVNGTDWTKLEGEFISLADEEVICYIELDNETEFYLDDVIIKQTYILPESVVSVDLVEDNDGKTYLMGVIAADAEGAVSYELSHTFLSQTFYDISARLMLDSESVTETAEAYTAYKKLTGWGNGTPAGLESGVMTEVTYNAKPNTAAGTTTKKVAVYIEGAGANEVMYFGGFGLEPTIDSAAGDAEVTSVELVALVGNNSLVNVTSDANTVALRYAYYMQNEDESWTKIETGHTDSGVADSVPAMRFEESDVGKTIKVEVWPMNEDFVYGDMVESAPSVVKAPFEVSTFTPEFDSVGGTATAVFTITNTSGDDKYIAAVIACYNANDEMIGLGIQNILVENGEEGEEFTVTVENIEAADCDYYKLYMLDGDTVGELFPLADAK